MTTAILRGDPVQMVHGMACATRGLAVCPKGIICPTDITQRSLVVLFFSISLKSSISFVFVLLCYTFTTADLFPALRPSPSFFEVRVLRWK